MNRNPRLGSKNRLQFNPFTRLKEAPMKTTIGIMFAFLLGISITGCTLPDSCTDGTKNGDETGIDCGGKCAQKCQVGVVDHNGCNSGADCATGICLNQRCYPAACGDGIRNGDESDIDCGGNSCPKCGGGKVCITGTDCASEKCLNGKCTDPGTNGSPDAGITPSLPDMTEVAKVPTVDMMMVNDLTPPCNQTRCGNACIDTSSDSSNCGKCGNACVGGQTCQNGACSCFVGEMSCLGKCVNTLSDASNCGACGNLCQPGEVCSAGKCTVQCGKPSVICGGNQCIDIVNDPRHCGGCNMACSANHMKTVTCQGFCNGECLPGFANCSGDKQADGCDVNLSNDPKHCGDCATVCPARPNASASCANSTCAITCNVGFGNCDFWSGNGCEINTQTDPSNCGGCAGFFGNGGAVCAQNEQCMNGKCTKPAPSCNDKQKNGFESDVDCGGGSCPRCDLNKACLVDADCLGKCVNGVCKSTANQFCAVLSDCAPGLSCSMNVCVQQQQGCNNNGIGPCKTDADCCAGSCDTGANNGVGLCRPSIVTSVTDRQNPKLVAICPGNLSLTFSAWDNTGNKVVGPANPLTVFWGVGWNGWVMEPIWCDGQPLPGDALKAYVGQSASALGLQVNENKVDISAPDQKNPGRRQQATICKDTFSTGYKIAVGLPDAPSPCP